ncbi:hypothetical protein CK203_019349 [Vitis vinifera]|uniref:Uncharacterized protein n=1 Tax=Vitis vinifera TaxID=29760 RepID=A0A438IYS8_VITVI|nr:hypothetical protein CK203_019349 [Vitis vinifera]
MVPRIIHEPDGEEDMATNLKTGFKERQRNTSLNLSQLPLLLLRNPSLVMHRLRSLLPGRIPTRFKMGPSLIWPPSTMTWTKRKLRLLALPAKRRW